MVRKQDLVQSVATELDESDAQATKAVNAVFNAITQALAQGDEVNISGFGSFRVVERSARAGRNPRSGEPMMIEARKSAAFRPGANLKRAVEEAGAAGEAG